MDPDRSGGQRAARRERLSDGGVGQAGIQRENITQGEAHPGPGDLTASAKSYIDADGGSIHGSPKVLRKVST
jgi:hypothetical protein